jgi:hypothetical protein
MVGDYRASCNMYFCSFLGTILDWIFLLYLTNYLVYLQLKNIYMIDLVVLIDPIIGLSGVLVSSI